MDLGECARIWKGGCIIRAGFLDRIKSAYVRDPDLSNLLVDADFAAELNRRQPSWRRIVSLCVASGIAAPAMSSSLSYFDAYRRERLPANLTQVNSSLHYFYSSLHTLLQAQRDYFGGHSFERIDQSGVFHAKWTSAHHDIGNVEERNAGNL